MQPIFDFDDVLARVDRSRDEADLAFLQGLLGTLSGLGDAETADTSSRRTSAQAAPLDGDVQAMLLADKGIVQAMLLADEDIVEGILFTLGGRAPRATVRSVVDSNERILDQLSRASQVCRAWRVAAARPLLAARLDLALAKVKLAADFFAQKRDLLIQDPAPSIASDRLASAEADVLRWLIGGYENGLNSILVDDRGLNTMAPCVAFLHFLTSTGRGGPYLVVADEREWPAWRQQLQETGVPWMVYEARDGHDLCEAVEATLEIPARERKAAVVLVCMTPDPRTGTKDTFAAFEAVAPGLVEGGHVVIYDERDLVEGGVGSLALQHTGHLFGKATSLVRISHEPLPNDYGPLLRTLATSLTLPVQFGETMTEQVTNILDFHGDHHLRRWAVDSFLVPSIQTMLCQSAYMRRVQRDGKPVSVQTERPHVVVEVASSSHWMLGSKVRMAKCLVLGAFPAARIRDAEAGDEPEDVMGRTGYVNYVDEHEHEDLFTVRLEATSTSPSRYLQGIKLQHIAQVISTASEAERRGRFVTTGTA